MSIGQPQNIASKRFLTLIVFIFSVCLLFVSYIITDGNSKSKWPYLVSADREDRQFQTTIKLDGLDPDKESIKYTIPWVNTGYTTLTEYEKLCINQITVKQRSLSYTSWSYKQGQLPSGVGSEPSESSLQETTPLPQELCKSRGISPKINDDKSRSPAENLNLHREGEASVIFFRYFYPYDEINVEFSVYFPGYFEQQGVMSKIDLIPNVNWQVNLPGWELAASQATETNVEAKIILRLQRPYVYRVMTPLLVLCALTFIFSLPFIRDLGSLAQVATGLVIGLWGLRQITMPSEIQWSTILDPIFVSLYALLGVSILIRMLITTKFSNTQTSQIATEEQVLMRKEQQIHTPPSLPKAEKDKTSSRISLISLFVGVVIAGIVAVLAKRKSSK